MCDKAILENGGRLKSVPDCYKIKKVNTYPHALEFVPECYKAQQMCDTNIDSYVSTIKFVPECFMTQKMCDKVVNRCYFVFDCIPD